MWYNSANSSAVTYQIKLPIIFRTLALSDKSVCLWFCHIVYLFPRKDPTFQCSSSNRSVVFMENVRGRVHTRRIGHPSQYVTSACSLGGSTFYPERYAVPQYSGVLRCSLSSQKCAQRKRYRTKMLYRTQRRRVGRANFAHPSFVV